MRSRGPRQRLAAGAELPAAQQPVWPDTRRPRRGRGDARDATRRSSSPASATCSRDRMAAARRGEAFVLQGGDCAETFASATADNIRDRVKTILQMAAVLTYGASVPVVKIGRMAGQYAKPRSSSNDETREGVPCRPTAATWSTTSSSPATSRTPDPQRLVRAYHASSATLNLVRAFTTGGFADLRHVHDWNKGFIANSANVRYERLAKDIDKAMKFMEACGADFEAMRTTEFFSAHEALVLDYERPMTRIDSRTGDLYDTSGHFVWVGERTRDLDGAHIDFVAAVRNPVGVKVSANADTDDLLRIIDKVDPEREPGPAHLHHPDGGRPHPRGAADHRREGHGIRRAGHLGLRPDARQHLRVGLGLQDPRLRRRRRGGRGLLRGAPRPRHGARRHPRRAHRQRRHRVRRRRRRRSSTPTSTCATSRCATRA